jgi:hypothetical protein
MSGAYVVVAIAHNKLEVLETYAGVQSALGRAWNLATSRHDLSVDEANASPPEDRMPDGSVRWVVLQNAHAFVGVFYKKIQTSLMPKKDLAALDTLSYAWVPPAPPPRGFAGNPPPTKPVPYFDVFDGYQELAGASTPVQFVIHLDGDVSCETSTPAPTPVPFKDDPGEDSLPGGWNLSGKPITMQSIYDDPSDVTSHMFLSKTQQWALARARISKRPDYALALSNGLYVQSAALQCLGKSPDTCNDYGWEIVGDEMEYLSSVVYGLINH